MQPGGPPEFHVPEMQSPWFKYLNHWQLPTPRPEPYGVAGHIDDQITIVWMVIFGGLSLAAMYACARVYSGDQQRLMAAAAVVFLALSGLVGWRWLLARGRRVRLVVHGRAVPGQILEETRITERQRGGGFIGSYHRLRIAFEDKEVTITRTSHGGPNLVLFVDGQWAGRMSVSGSVPPTVEYAKWTMRRR